MRTVSLLLFSLVTLLLVSEGCANPHFFPRMRPLFAGLDESKVPRRSQVALAQAKADFQLARAHAQPRYAKFVGLAPSSQTRLYQGNGYRIALVQKEAFFAHSHGPQIVIEGAITGGMAYHYDEVDEVVD